MIATATATVIVVAPVIAAATVIITATATRALIDNRRRNEDTGVYRRSGVHADEQT